MTRVAIIGHASLDHVALLDGAPRAGRTTTVLARPEDAWPRLGGSPAYVAAALMACGVPQACPVSWIGADEAGEAYHRQLLQRGILNGGLAVVKGARTPVSVLAYQPDGGCLCLHDPGVPEDQGLSPTQWSLISEADWLCVAIGPPRATEEALDAAGCKCRIAWIIKHDPRSMPLTLAARIAACAELIFCSGAERAFLEESVSVMVERPQGQMLIETRSRSGAVVWRGGRETFVATAPLEVGDPTGAGDTFAGGALAAVIRGEEDPAAIVEAGHSAAGALLATRPPRQTESI